MDSKVHISAAMVDNEFTRALPTETPMNVNNPNRTSVGSSAGTASARHSEQYGEDFHLAELVRTLRSLAGDSPERQAKMERLMRAYARGELRVDAEATASAIIDDAELAHSRR